MSADKIPTSTIAEMCELVVDCPHFTPAWTDDGYIVIRNQNIRNGRLDLTSPSFTHREDFERRIRRAKPQAGDIVITREAPMGEVCLVPDGVECCLGQRQVLLRPKPNVDPEYLYCALQSPFVRKQIFWNEGTGSTVSNIRIPVMEAIEIPRWPKEESAIAATIIALDDKMELNQRMNETLEHQARALFRDWFVDFGPVKARQAGDAPYLAPDLWSLFPDRLDDDGVPEGWTLGSLDQLIEFNPREKLTKGKDAPYLDMASLPTRGSGADAPAVRAFTSGSKFRNGDALLARITPCLENGKTAFVDGLAEDAIGWGSTEFIVMRSKSPVPPQVAYLIARDPEFRGTAIRSMSGTSGRQRASVNALTAYFAAIPDDEKTWVVLGSLLDPIFYKIAANAEENQTLAQTRDLLLPKLMSGEIRVGEAEREVEKVA
ncbi:hypothetical protein GCM10023219_32440 [Stakelama sediminis]|uniref:Type I restriction enzyme S subunit n=1 Tax=Stakelama sediminis TaxID=463200 RepID=A0A840Z1E9_9SPHN|nr:restriction endonuclease subunit S [Stakelama sediminis]MBB5719564.1 type I restriction enzyme S subunit [Stakelama sediminis]